MNIYKVGVILDPAVKLEELCASIDSAGMAIYSRPSVTKNPNDPLELPLGQFVVTFGESRTGTLIETVASWFLEQPGRHVCVKVGDTLQEVNSANDIEKHLTAGTELFCLTHPAGFDENALLRAAGAEFYQASQRR